MGCTVEMLSTENPDNEVEVSNLKLSQTSFCQASRERLEKAKHYYNCCCSGLIFTVAYKLMLVVYGPCTRYPHTSLTYLKSIEDGILF